MQSFYFYSKNSFSKNIHYVIHLIFENGINNAFSSRTCFLLVSSDTHAMRNKKTVESLGFNNFGYKCNEFSEVAVIFCKTCREYYSINTISMVQTSLESLENLEIWLIFWKIWENLEKSGRKFKKLFKSWRSHRGFFDKAGKPISRLFLLKLKSKMCVLRFSHDRLLFIFDLFFNILIIGFLIVNCILYLGFFFRT